MDYFSFRKKHINQQKNVNYMFFSTYKIYLFTLLTYIFNFYSIIYVNKVLNCITKMRINKKRRYLLRFLNI